MYSSVSCHLDTGTVDISIGIYTDWWHWIPWWGNSYCGEPPDDNGCGRRTICVGWIIFSMGISWGGKKCGCQWRQCMHHWNRIKSLGYGPRQMCAYDSLEEFRAANPPDTSR